MRQPADPAHQRALLQRCGAGFRHALEPLLGVTLQRVDEVLYELADKAEDNRRFAAYLDAQRVLRAHSASIKRQSLSSLQRSLEQFLDNRGLAPPTPSANLAHEEMTLVDPVDLEETLAINNLISKAEARYRAPLGGLVAALTLMTGRGELSVQDLPIAPKALCNAFADAVRSLPECEHVIRLAVYKVFDKQVMDNLEDLYRDCLESIRPVRRRAASGRSVARPKSSGSLPPAPAAAPEAPGRGKQPAAPATPAARAAAAPSHSASANNQATADLHRSMRRYAPDVPPRVRTETLGRDALLTVLGQVQARISAGEATLAPRGAVVAALRDALPGPGTPVPGVADQDTMDLVFLLFEEILAGPELPEPIKVLVGRIQIPYVKLALIDPDFFDDPAHPARRLLDHIGDAARGWNDDGARGPDSFHGRIRLIVERIITEPEGGRELFGELEAQLRQDLAKADADARVMESQAVQRRIDRGRREQAQFEVTEAIEERLAPFGQVPVVIAELVERGLAPALVEAHLREGPGGAALRDRLALLDTLLWSIRPKRDTAERRELLRRIPELLRPLRAALGEVDCDPTVVARWLKELQTIHIAVLRGPGWGGISTRVPDVALTDADTSMPSSYISSTEMRREALIPPVGSWLMLRGEGAEPPMRGKLAWRSEDGEDLLLVDRDGRPLAELTADDLCHLDDKGLVQPLGGDDEPLITRGLDAVRRSLAAP